MPRAIIACHAATTIFASDGVAVDKIIIAAAISLLLPDIFAARFMLIR